MRSQILGSQKLAEISARSQSLIEILVEISKSPRPKNQPRISARSWRDLKILAAKNSPRFLRRSQNLGGQKLTKNPVKILSNKISVSDTFTFTSHLHVATFNERKIVFAETRNRGELTFILGSTHVLYLEQRRIINLRCIC